MHDKKQLDESATAIAQIEAEEAAESAAGQVVEAIEGGTLDNAKPIYCHPITISNTADATYNFRLTLLIFNNSSVEYNKTTFESFISNIPQARFLSSGSVIKKGAGGFYMASAFVYFNPSAEPAHLWIIGIDNNGDDHTSGVDPIDLSILLVLDSTSFYDGVNKIN